MRRWAIGCLSVSFFGCCIMPMLLNIFAPVDFLINITFGWFVHIFRILTQVQFSAINVLIGLVCLTVVAIGSHWIFRWANSKRPLAESGSGDLAACDWPIKRTAAILGIVLLIVVAGISAVGVFNHSIWIVTSGERFAEGFPEPAPLAKTMNDMKQIGMAMHNYAGSNGQLPTAASWNKNKDQPLLSWRVMILSFIEEQELYREFHRDEPWDSPHNIRLIPRMPKLYAARVDNDPTPSFHTHFRVFTGKDTAFDGREGMRLSDFADIDNKTLLVVEANQPVLWTKPDELIYDPNEPLPPLGFRRPEYFLALLVNGAARRIYHTTPEQDIRAWITRHGEKKEVPSR
jgi:hypothetical protein